jgi:hypothetical protein
MEDGAKERKGCVKRYVDGGWAVPGLEVDAFINDGLAHPNPSLGTDRASRVAFYFLSTSFRLTCSAGLY